MVKWPWAIAITIALFAPPSADAADRRLEPLLGCSSVEQCITAIQSFDRPNNIKEADAIALADHLSTFGEPLEKFVKGGSGKGVNALLAILAWFPEKLRWPQWQVTDIPFLTVKLQSERQAWAADGLASIGTDAALIVLAADLINGDGTPAYGSLSRLGVRAIPFVIPMMARDLSRNVAENVLFNLGSVPESTLPLSWLSDTARSLDERIGLLRALMVLHLESAIPRIEPLASDPSPQIAREARRAIWELQGMDLRVTLQDLKYCDPWPTDMSAETGFNRSCLWDVPWSKEDGMKAEGAARFFASPDPSDQAAAATILGYFDKRDNIDQIVPLLKSRDWAAVYAAAQSLGWLKATVALTKLREVAAHHWYPPVRVAAEKAIARIESASADPPVFAWRDVELLWRRSFATPADDCHRGPRQWNGHSFKWQSGEREVTELPLPGGRLRATDLGEFGGNLSWVPDGGPPQNLHSDNAFAVFPDGDGAVAIFGLGHMGLDFGYVMRVRRVGSNTFELDNIGRLPSYPIAAAASGDGIFGVSAGGLNIFFDHDRILASEVC